MIKDISRPIHPDMAIYPGNPAVEILQIQQATDNTSALTRITIGSHTGTHIDAPSHIDPLGKGVDSLTLESMIGKAQVADLSLLSSVISAADMPGTSCERLLFKTKNSQEDRNRFDSEFVALDESAAEECVKRGIKLVGIDALSIKKKGIKDRVHAILLDAGIVILEGLWLADVSEGIYELLCLPLPLQSIDGAPVRAVLRTLDE